MHSSDLRDLTSHNKSGKGYVTLKGTFPFKTLMMLT